MYFFRKGGKQVLDMRGNLILSHNDALVKSRVSSSSPRYVRNPLYVVGIPDLSVWRKLRVTWQAVRFIWGRDQALTKETINREEI